VPVKANRACGRVSGPPSGARAGPSGGTLGKVFKSVTRRRAPMTAAQTGPLTRRDDKSCKTESPPRCSSYFILSLCTHVASFTSSPLQHQPPSRKEMARTPSRSREHAHRRPCSMGARWEPDGGHRAPSGPIEQSIRWAFVPDGRRWGPMGDSSGS